jgi:tetratricopeptide (TPR) repeat protein
MVTRKAGTILVLLTFLALLSGCLQDAINASNQQLAQQQAELDQLKRQVAALQTQQAQHWSTAPTPPNGCDTAVMREATRKGGERLAAGDLNRALGYYEDAATACPSSAQAQLNLAHAYESIGDRASALSHYQLAAEATGPNAEAGAVQRAREAIARMGGAT